MICSLVNLKRILKDLKYERIRYVFCFLVFNLVILANHSSNRLEGSTASSKGGYLL